MRRSLWSSTIAAAPDLLTIPETSVAPRRGLTAVTMPPSNRTAV
jgi:hypothetical protein